MEIKNESVFRLSRITSYVHYDNFRLLKNFFNSFLMQAKQELRDGNGDRFSSGSSFDIEWECDADIFSKKLCST